ncbi:MAG: LamG-like jellyroll fold domain-containing protein [Verrucomicrobiota bacterium]|nr:LamG-like jellyroll fold domain-containing protein [Verrucomicrobiota bacterium]
MGAQTFVGTNSPGTGTDFVITLGVGSTNLSLVVSNSGTAWSHLLLKRGGAPTDANFDFISRLDGVNNRINLEWPEFVPTNYGLRVRTPSGSATHAFQVVLTTNRADLRSAAYPVLKPVVFSVSGSLSNLAGGHWHYFQVDVPTNLPGWRLVLSGSPATNTPDLYVQRGALPNTGSYLKRSTGQQVDTVVLTDTEAINSTYFIGVYLPSGAPTNTVYQLATEPLYLRDLVWDPGLTHEGTQVFTNTSPTGGNYFFRIIAQSSTVGAWRTALRVDSGEAHLYLRQGTFSDDPTSYPFKSERAGDDGFVLHSSQFSAGQTWYLCVSASPGAQWRLVTGEAHVLNLGTLAGPDSSASSTNVVIGPEGMRFFRTTTTPDTLAWRLWLNGATNDILVKKTAVPHPLNTSTYDLKQAGQMLVVPTYLVGGDQYFVGVPGTPGTLIQLDSRQQRIIDAPFICSSNLVVTGFGYVTYRINVPVEQIAWLTTLTPTSGEAHLCVRRDRVPNEWNNDAFSEVAGTTTDSISLVPPPPGSGSSTPGLSDGVFFVTIYGVSNYNATFTSGNPVITDVPFVSVSTNDDPTRVGWRYYRVLDITNQLGVLGWELFLQNQPPNTELAIRRNAVPGRWNYRQNNSPTVLSYGHVDASSQNGYLQRPGHPADVWYIGAYNPSNALGAFVLHLRELSATPFSSDGALTNVTAHPAGRFLYWRVDVPAGPLGWEIRLANVTNGDPRLVVRRDALPTSLVTEPWTYPSWATSWPSGNQWAAANDWTGLNNDPAGNSEWGRILACGMGNPLQPGTYYVGVLDASGNNNPMSYTLVSRFIGPGYSIPVTPLAFTNGVAHITNLPPRAVAYFQVNVPTNAEGWDVRLATNAGESLLIIQRDALPNVGAGRYSADQLRGGRWVEKPGNEEYLLLPPSGATNIPGGTYYLAVVSEGHNPNRANSRIGTGAISATLTSFGPMIVTNLGTLSATDLVANVALAGGDAHAWRFNVPPGVEALEVWLENKTGNPRMHLRADQFVPSPSENYGFDGGHWSSVQSDSLITWPAPLATNFTLMVQARSTEARVYPNATFTIRVRRVNSTPLAFDGGTVTIGSGHMPGTWRYFAVTVPSNALGWDIRLTNVTSGDPRLVVRRDFPPGSLATDNDWFPSTWSTWPSGRQWAAGTDWTENFIKDADGTNRLGHILQMGMGNPLQPGTYYVGVINGSSSGYGANEMRYTLVSRGIGPGFSIPVTPLAFTNGVALITNLPPREAAYFSVAVPSNVPSWRVRLSTNIGESLLMIQRGALPNVGGGNNSAYFIGGGRKMMKVGDEHYLALGEPGQTNLPAGTYYLLVASMGQNPAGTGSDRLGTNTISATVQSFGVEAPLNLGTVLPGADIVHADALDGGATRLYQFTVLPGTLSMEVRLENRVGNPLMSLRPGELAPQSYGDYGEDGGQYTSWMHDSQILVGSPTPGIYTLLVHAHRSGPPTAAGQVYPNAGYSIRVRVIGDTPIAFDGGLITVTNHEPNTWRYFVVSNVPADALGWDVRLTNVWSGDPRIVIRRASAPTSFTGPDWYPQLHTHWPSNYQWTAGHDWTGYAQDADGTNRFGHTLQMGLNNPLSPGGPYYIGVFNGSYSGWGTNIMRYTLMTRGIGPGYSIPVRPVAFSGGSVTNAALAPRDAAYYYVDVPSNTPSWKVRLGNLVGESLLLVQKDYLPNVLGGVGYHYPATDVGGGYKMQKAGNEHYVLLPSAGQSFIPPGRYYLLVASEGQFPNTAQGRIGTNFCSFVLQSLGELPVDDLGVVPPNGVSRTNMLEGGELRAYRFTVPAGTLSFETRLENRVGNPYLTLRADPVLPRAYSSYGNNGGATYVWSSDRLVTLANPNPTNYALLIQAAPQGSTFADASYVLRIVPSTVTALALDPVLQGCGPGGQPCTNALDCRTLADNERAFYRVQVPATLPDGSPVIGWQLTLSNQAGNAQVRVRPGALPSDAGPSDQTGFVTDQAVIVPPYLTPGIWFVEVKGVGPSEYCLYSSAVRLYRPAWNMPAPGEPITTPGLTNGPFFADTGIQTNGIPLPQPDGGIDLEAGRFHYYAVAVPTNNGGLMRMFLEAISGNPDVFIRVGNLPTLTHTVPIPVYGSTAYERSLTGLTSEYGNWVPRDGRYTNGLDSGTWFIAVRATGTANCRYRLRLSTGNVTDLALHGSVTNQTVAAGDWRYYRFFLPTNAPTNWVFSFQQHIGDVIVYVRDTVPPGQYASVTDFRDWANDDKNHAGGLYRTYDPPGTYTNWVPPLRPGHVYYLGFRALSDATFSLSSSTNTTTIGEAPSIAFYGGSISNVLAPGERQRYVIDVPPDGTRWISSATHPSSVRWYLEQGSLPTETSADHRWSGGGANVGINQLLNQPNGWPWLSGYRYYLVVTNTSSTAQPFSWRMDGRNCATDDSDNDSLPDCWELLYWPSIYTQTGSQDFDGDGNSNLLEYQDGTNPTNPQSMLARLTLSTVGSGSVNVVPLQSAYPWGTSVSLTAVPVPGHVFLAWTGPGISGSTNPLSLLMTTNRHLTAWFGLSNYVACGSLQADYRFQNNLLSTVAAPPALAFINTGQSFTNDIVDGVPRTVLRFPQGTGLVLSNATSVIPSNTYTIVLLFKFNTTTGWRRILDTKNASPDHGLYVNGGFLNFYPAGVQSPTICVTNNTWHQIVVTRDLTGLITVYSDGVPRLSFNDTAGYGLISAANTLRFFKDDGSDESAGAVARIRLFTCALSVAEVAALDRLPAVSPLALTNAALDAQRRFYFQITGPALPLVRVQTSSNLINWSNAADYSNFPGSVWHTNPTPATNRQFFRVQSFGN